jgi:hypothetical protein
VVKDADAIASFLDGPVMGVPADRRGAVVPAPVLDIDAPKRSSRR